LFTTGQGNIVGNPVLPTIKITANPLTAETMPEHIDVDVSGLLRFEYPLDGAADRTMEVMAKTINGRLTCAETLRHDDFVITKLYRSA
jgi:(2R)-sulfolactate sulfo-lyase subunit beta